MLSQLRNRHIIFAIFTVTAAASLSTSSAAFRPIGASSRRPLLKTLVKNPRGGRRSPAALSAVVFDNGQFWQSQAVFAGANALGLVISLATGSHLHLDLLGTGAYALAAAVPFLSGVPMLPRVTLSSIAVFIWGFKLAGFLFFRVLKVKKDARLTDTLSSGSGAAVFWMISMLWGFICSLPFTLGATSSSPGNPTAIKVGSALYVVGLITESLADYQKWVFKQSNPGQFCNVGLWSMSRHPNFLGNLMIWSGIFLMNASALVDPEGDSFFAMYKRVGLALLSPLFLYVWFYGQASGTVSNTVEMFQEKYGNQPGFQDYVENVPLIFPNPLKKLVSK